MPKQLLLLLISLLATVFTAMSAIPPEVIIHQNAAYAFRFSTASAPALNNYFIKEIARYNYLNLYKTQYTLYYELEVKLTENPDGNYKAQSALKRQKMEGDIFYEQFDLSEALMPSGCNYELVDGDGEAFATISFDNRTTSEPVSIKRSGNLAASDYKIANIRFSYDDADRQYFEQYMEEVHRYLAFYELLDFNLEKAIHLQPDDASRLPEDFFRAYDIFKFQIALQQYHPQIQVPEVYNDHFINNQINLNAQARRLSTLLQLTSSQIPAPFSRQELEAASQTAIGLQQEYLQKLKKAHYLFEPQYLATANFLATEADLENMNALLSQLLLSHFPKEEQLALSETIRKTLYQASISVAESMMKNENYNEALLMLDNAQTLCNAHPDDDCELYLFHQVSRTRYGIYDSYLKVAATARNANNSQMALKYLLLARNFQQTNSNLILSAGAVDRALDELAWQTLQLAGDRQQQQKNQQALDDYLCAQQIYQIIGIDKYHDVIERNIQKLSSGQ
ncbi:MAG: hypothetical protein EOM83_08790 [Clostridia bacterium]|nr:hypothetical protein [Clostridia bacterium]